MKRTIDRRELLRFSALSLGAGALLRFTPADAALRDHFKRANGEAPSPFSIVQLSDTHVGFNGPPDPLGTKAFERAVDVINALDPQPELVLFTGDLTHDSDDAGEHARRMQTFRAISGRLRAAKRFHVPGEHDAALDGGALFSQHFGPTRYSFDHRGIHFVALDNVSLGRPAVGADQMAWLRKDLARYRHSVPLVVFTHRPLFDLRPDWEWFTSDGDEVMNALAPYQSVTVLYGHIHRPHHATRGTAQHHAARSLIFAFPDPATAAEKKALPFDAAAPFRNLGLRVAGGPAPLAIDDVELTVREIAGTEGVQQLLKGVEA